MHSIQRCLLLLRGSELNPCILRVALDLVRGRGEGGGPDNPRTTEIVTLFQGAGSTEVSDSLSRHRGVTLAGRKTW
jgi:hypothetical protein